MSLKKQGIQYFRQQLEMALREFIPIIEPQSVPNFEELLDFNNINDCEDERSFDIEENEEEENTSNEEFCSDKEDNLTL